MGTRRQFLAWLGPVAAYPLVAAHHRPGHAGGPPRRASPVGYGRVVWAELKVPAAPPGGFSDGYAEGCAR